MKARDFYDKRIKEDSKIGSVQLMEEYANLTKEQIRTELIEIFNELTTTTNNRDFLLGIGRCKQEVGVMLPPETPEKIAERKAVEMLVDSGWEKQDEDYFTILNLLKVAILINPNDLKK